MKLLILKIELIISMLNMKIYIGVNAYNESLNYD